MQWFYWWLYPRFDCWCFETWQHKQAPFDSIIWWRTELLDDVGIVCMIEWWVVLCAVLPTNSFNTQDYRWCMVGVLAALAAYGSRWWQVTGSDGWVWLKCYSDSDEEAACLVSVIMVLHALFTYGSTRRWFRGHHSNVSVICTSARYMKMTFSATATLSATTCPLLYQCHCSATNVTSVMYFLMMCECVQHTV